MTYVTVILVAAGFLALVAGSWWLSGKILGVGRRSHAKAKTLPRSEG